MCEGYGSHSVCLSVCYTPRSNWHGLTVVLLFFSVLTFGFELVVYNVRESIGSVDLGIFFISGNAGEFVPHVNVSTVDGTAICKYCIV